MSLAEVLVACEESSINEILKREGKILSFNLQNHEAYSPDNLLSFKVELAKSPLNLIAVCPLELIRGHFLSIKINTQENSATVVFNYDFQRPDCPAGKIASTVVEIKNFSPGVFPSLSDFNVYQSQKPDGRDKFAFPERLISLDGKLNKIPNPNAANYLLRQAVLLIGCYQEEKENLKPPFAGFAILEVLEENAFPPPQVDWQKYQENLYRILVNEGFSPFEAKIASQLFRS